MFSYYLLQRRVKKWRREKHIYIFFLFCFIKLFINFPYLIFETKKEKRKKEKQKNMRRRGASGSSLEGWDPPAALGGRSQKYKR